SLTFARPDEHGARSRYGESCMERSPEEPVIVWRGVSERECADLSLVLTARGIRHQRIADTRGLLLLVVQAVDARIAGDEIAAYRAERETVPAQPPELGNHPGAWIG